MLQAEKFTVALIENNDDQWFVVGLSSDIQRLNNVGAVERAWDIKLDNGHRPYAVLKKRLNFDITDESANAPHNTLTLELTKRFNINFAGDLYYVTKTYLLRRTPAFWSELGIVFADDKGLVENLNPGEFYAVYQGCILHNISGVKFVRLGLSSISRAIFPALS